jgi:hypothetical protein
MDEQDLLKAGPAEVIQAAYSDEVSDTLKEVGKISVDFAKTARLLLFPVQFGAMLQDRLARHLRNAIERVPSEARIPPVESLALRIGEKLRYEEEGTAVAEMYVNLLSRAMDKERVPMRIRRSCKLWANLLPMKRFFFNSCLNVTRRPTYVERQVTT